MSQALLEVEDLSVVYETAAGTMVGAAGVNLSLRPGEMLALVGESGSGKSSAASGILRLLPGNGRVSAGRVLLTRDGVTTDLATAGDRELRRLRATGIAYVPQATAGALNPVRRVEKHFSTVLRAHGVKRAEHQRIAEEALRHAGVSETARVLRAYPHELSGGLAQRVIIAMSQMMSPSVLIADEPTSALDVRVQREVLSNLRATVLERGAAAVLITHDLGVAASYCDSVTVMYGGYAVEQGATAEVLKAPSHPYTRRLLAAAAGTLDRAALRRSQGRFFDRSVGTAGTRCPYAAMCGTDAACAQGMPQWQGIGPRHQVREHCRDD